MTEKELKTIEEIVKYMEKNMKYGYYTDNKYTKTTFEKLFGRKEMNCSDRQH